MATAAAVERFKAQGKQQLNVWVDTDTAALLKTLSAQRQQAYGDILRDALVSLHAGQPVAPATPATGGDSLDRLSLSVSRLHDEIASVRSIIGDWSSSFESRLSDLQDDLESRIQHLEATINSTPVMPIPSNNYAPETPVLAAPGAKKTPVKRAYTRAPDSYRDERDKRFIKLHNEGKTPSEISKIFKGEGLNIGTSPSNIHDFLKEQGLTPHSSRK